MLLLLMLKTGLTAEVVVVSDCNNDSSDAWFLSVHGSIFSEILVRVCSKSGQI
ncbi:hypothetical protein HanRHA438_Chr05g0218601 [Helianthus annuus]|nr:hypothetical protein HanOQP8_Chr05g0181741 [Helianthus annuus]KAJ0918498.1 hypothetical protein HanRHA438_Chr05g0218601 [Helianthus annuus]KAJ0922292.1 hypothetical protein HanPSC8_Chr05g0202031 [Helianthus annuus]